MNLSWVVVHCSLQSATSGQVSSPIFQIQMKTIIQRQAKQSATPMRASTHPTTRQQSRVAVEGISCTWPPRTIQVVRPQVLLTIPYPDSRRMINLSWPMHLQTWLKGGVLFFSRTRILRSSACYIEGTTVRVLK